MKTLALLALIAGGCELSLMGKEDDGGSTPPSPQEDGGSKPGDGPTMQPGPPPQGTIPLALSATAAATDVVVSLGVPFPQGTLSDPALLAVKDAAGNEVAAYSASLATWPKDGSQRSVLVAFRATLGSGASASWSIEYGSPRKQSAATLAANPDGPIVALLDGAWYVKSRVIGYAVSAAQNTRFATWDSEIEKALTTMSPAWSTYGLSCATTSSERTYYDSPHAMWQRAIYRTSATAYRRAREESNWYRANELDWYQNRNVAVYKCEANWDPARSMDWGSLRRMLGQGMLDDYLVTGDPAALEVVHGLGEAFRQNMPALTSGTIPVVKITERNMAWPMMGLASYYAIDHRAEVKDALTKLVDMTVTWQAASGAFEHDINRPDPSECETGPRGGSPFMTSLLVDGLMDAWLLTGDTRIPQVITRTAAWYQSAAISTGGTAFRYLWNCTSDPYDNADAQTLNGLIVHVFGAAYAVSSDDAWLTFGDKIADYGVDEYYGGKPKQWSQWSRSFVKYMGYRALGRTP